VGRILTASDPFENQALDSLNVRLSALVEIGIELATAASSGQLVETFSRRAAGLLEADIVSVTIANGEARRFTAGPQLEARWETLGDLASLERLERECRSARVIGHSHRLMALLETPEELSSAIAVELKMRRGPSGLLWLGKRDGVFSLPDRRIASMLAAQLAAAYGNVSVHESQTADFERTNRSLEAVFDLAPVAIVVVSVDGRVWMWNHVAERMFGWTAAEVIGREQRHLPAEMGDEARDLWKQVLAGETIASFETKRCRADGSLIDVSLCAATLRDDAGDVLGIIEIYSDDAERMHRAADLEALSARLVVAQEEERTRVARYIHDELGQLLTAAMIEISMMTPAQSAERIPRAVELLERTIESVRRIAADLRPAVLDELGLVAAVENELGLFQRRTGIEVELSIRPASLRLDPERSTAVFRVIQEAMTNVVRHAEATRVEVRLRQSRAETLLQIRDNGVGIDPAAVHSSRSLGIIGIRERVRAVGGSVGIEGVPGRGTIFTVRIPAQPRT